MQKAPIVRAYNYRIDAKDRITSVNGDWLSFARENSAPQLTVANTVGRPLLDYITGMETREIYKMVLDRVRATGVDAVIPFRCDGPSVRRFMELEISPRPDGAVEFTGRTIRDEPRGAVPLFDVSVDRGDGFLVICSWCKRVEVDSTWMDVERAVTGTALFSCGRLPQLTHGLCCDCASRLAGKQT